MGTILLAEKQPTSESEHSLLANDNVMNEWSPTSTTIYVFTTYTGTSLPFFRYVMSAELKKIKIRQAERQVRSRDMKN